MRKAVYMRNTQQDGISKNGQSYTNEDDTILQDTVRRK